MNPLASLRADVEGLAPDQLPAAIGALAEAQALATLRLHASQSEGAPEPEPDRLLTAPEVAEMLSVSVKWVYANAGRLGVVKLSQRAVRFPARAIRRYILARQQGDRP